MAVRPPAASDLFTSRWGVILAGIGMAVGTGNLWRFPRVAAENGGGSFLIPWLLALFLWSIPLLIAEFGLGRGARRGPIGAFSALIGRRTAWMGGFVVVTTVMIMFYYSVVTGWTLKYVLAALTGDLAGVDTAAYWERYSASVWQPVLFHMIGDHAHRRRRRGGRDARHRARQPDHHAGALRAPAGGRRARRHAARSRAADWPTSSCPTSPSSPTTAPGWRR